jgi:aldose sugar dehydrogenase
MLINLTPDENNAYFTYAIASEPQSREYLPVVTDDRLKVEIVFKGVESPTSVAFLGPDDILVLEKDSGKVRRVLNGSILPEPLIDLAVATERERGLLGIAAANRTHNGTTHAYVYLYFTVSKFPKDGFDSCPPPDPYYCEQRSEPLGNRLYRYEMKNNTFVNPKLLLDLPATPGPNHNGGVVLVGPDENVYTVIGDLLTHYDKELGSKSLNLEASGEPDGRGSILRITPEGHTVGNGILGKTHPVDKYYAYGIRNSFGIDFDPLTGNLWDTENGPGYADEINLVEPGFNSGWIQIQGLWAPRSLNASEGILDLLPKNFSVAELDKHTLSDFQDNGNYSDPELIWNHTIGITALKFLDSDKLGKEYENDMYVGDFNEGNLYHFDLNKDRTELVLAGNLGDKIANTTAEINESEILFGRGFGGITDIEVGPYDGNLYVLSYRDGTLYRISRE